MKCGYYGSCGSSRCARMGLCALAVEQGVQEYRARVPAPPPESLAERKAQAREAGLKGLAAVVLYRAAQDRVPPLEELEANGHRRLARDRKRSALG